MIAPTTIKRRQLGNEDERPIGAGMAVVDLAARSLPGGRLLSATLAGLPSIVALHLRRRRLRRYARIYR